MEINKIYNEDCLEGMKRIPDKSIDMILCDLPYGTTACKWDSVIPFDLLWEQYNRIIKDDGIIALTSTQPFTTALIQSNIKKFKYTWIWDKVRPSGFQIAKYRPMMRHEDICIFGNKKNYKPIMTEREKIIKGKVRKSSESSPLKYNDGKIREYTKRYPQSILTFCKEVGLHPTQKPVALFEYLIKTYTDEGEVVLDNCIGSGTTAIACINTNRNFIGFEIEKEYVEIANNRIIEAYNKKEAEQ
jgi:site-specific DNA-methyltransferase (adenine-specific)